MMVFGRGPGGRLLRVLALGLCAAFLTACAAIPVNGSVVNGGEADEDPREGTVWLVPEGPIAGADPVGIVTGFLHAAVGFSDDHSVARSFLAPPQRLTWRPDYSVTVFPSESSMTVKQSLHPAVRSAVTVTGVAAGESRSGESALTATVVVHTPVQSQIDDDGRYSLAGPGRKLTTTFGLVKTGGQWRINSLSNGILLSANDFSVTFRPMPIYFTDPSGRFLVPDVHWFPAQDQPGSLELPTALVRVLLNGPPDYLRGAVSSGAPSQTRMAVSAVVVSNQIASVDLTDPARTADGRERQLLLSQLESTLSGLTNIAAVQITVRRSAFDVPAGGGGQSGQPIQDPSVDSKPLVIDAKNKLERLNGTQLEPVTDVTGLAVAGANRPAMSYDASAYAVLNADRSKLLFQAPGAKVATLLRSANLTAPSFDPEGWVWTTPATNTGAVYASADLRAVRVKAPWLKKFQVVSMRISRDGTRAALAVTYHGAAHVFVSGIIRDQTGRPLTLTAPIGQIPDLVSVRDLAWVNEDEIVVLGRRSSAVGERPWVAQIGGDVVAANPVPGAESIAAGNGDVSVLASTPKGTFGRSGVRWAKLTSARWAAFPG
jgi:hypothetical protein